MDFEYDSEKSQNNKTKHGIDFEKAQAIWLDAKRVVFMARFQDEQRLGIIGSWEDKLWCAIYTERGTRKRIISVRRARKYEEDLYNYSEGI